MADSIRIRLFATAREAVGNSMVEWPVSRAGVSAAELVRGLGERYPKLVPILRAARFVRNGRYLEGLSVTVRPGDEFSVHPPYGGG